MKKLIEGLDKALLTELYLDNLAGGTARLHSQDGSKHLQFSKGRKLVKYDTKTGIALDSYYLPKNMVNH